MTTNSFSQILLETIRLGAPVIPLSNTRFITLNNGDPGANGTANNVTSTITGVSRVNSTGLNFGTPTGGWAITNTSSLLVTGNASASVNGVSHFTIGDETRVLARGTFTSPFNVIAGDFVDIPIGTMTIATTNMGQAFATQALRGVWDETITLSLSTIYHIRLFSSLNAQGTGTEITGTLGLSAFLVANPGTTFSSIAGTPPTMSYSADMTFGTPTGSGTPTIAALWSAATGGNLIVYSNLTNPIQFTAGRPARIRSGQLTFYFA